MFSLKAIFQKTNYNFNMHVIENVTCVPIKYIFIKVSTFKNGKNLNEKNQDGIWTENSGYSQNLQQISNDSKMWILYLTDKASRFHSLLVVQQRENNL